MADVIRANYEAMEDMAKQCDAVAQRLVQTANVSQKISGQMQNGSLIGKHGEIYTQALGIFSTKVMKLSQKYSEEAKDIRAAITDMQHADGQVVTKFQ